MFSALESAVDLDGARVLDLYAGSGALGLEALSRGAREVHFVEQEAAAARNLSQQIERLGAAPQARVLEMGAERYLRGPAQPFDIVFLDPPFRSGAVPAIAAQLDQGGWLQAGSLVYLESARSLGAPTLPPHWELLKSKSAGEVGYHLARVQHE
jgi:16S rRNA (guanine966-N2)-methyltransferase